MWRILLFLTLLLQILVVSIRLSKKNIEYSYHSQPKDLSVFCPKYEENVHENHREVTANVLNKYSKGKMASSSGFYRPRSALARALYEKQRNDVYLQEFDQNQWYQVNKSRLPEDLQNKFIQLHPDEDTKRFLSEAVDKSSWVWTQIWYLIAKAVLRHFWSITDINGWLGRGSMFVTSEAQTNSLLNFGDRSPSKGSIVDIGAGDGAVSERFTHIYTEKYATEISVKMRNILQEKGFVILDTEDWWRSHQFDCVCMMNLLDRCTKPRTMLKQARTAISQDGVLMLALVLPYKPYVEVTRDHQPEERLPIEGVTFEDQVTSFVKFMSSVGFTLKSWSRAPYLCEGDFSQAYYWLDDSIYVFEPSSIQAGDI